MANGFKEPAPPLEQPPSTPQFPTHNAPRVWLLTSGDSPVGISLARLLLAHGDYVVCGIIPAEFEREDGSGRDPDDFSSFLSEAGRREGWRERVRLVHLDIRVIGQCQSAIAEAVHAFAKIDVLLCCTSQAVIGSVEELAASQRTRMLVRDQFETNFFGAMNVVRAVLPYMRARANGHIVVLSGITGHLGTPGLGAYCASQWALEGFCDSIAYEIAPFNVKLTIVQASIEIGILTNRISSVPPMSAYGPSSGNTAPLFRGIVNGLLNRLPGIKAEYPLSPSTVAMQDDLMSPSSEFDRTHGPSLLQRDDVVSLYPPLSAAHTEKLIAETLHYLTAIGGHENPPARVIVGVEGIASVKEKLKTVSEELEEFVDVSASVDLGKSTSATLRGRVAATTATASAKGDDEGKGAGKQEARGEILTFDELLGMDQD